MANWWITISKPYQWKPEAGGPSSSIKMEKFNSLKNKPWKETKPDREDKNEKESLGIIQVGNNKKAVSWQQIKNLSISHCHCHNLPLITTANCLLFCIVLVFLQNSAKDNLNMMAFSDKLFSYTPKIFKTTLFKFSVESEQRAQWN